jgi:murein DD-endopeptidase MepM/ murein hydrolase activator NlpD
MSFVMIAAGPTSSSRVRTVSTRSLLCGGVLVAIVLLATGAGLGLAVSKPVAPSGTPQATPGTPSPFTVEQLGKLSGRLFKLESQAGQLSERVGAMLGTVPRPGAAPRAAKGGSGGPMLPPRVEPDTREDLGALESRLAEIEQRIALVSDAATLQNLALMRLPTRMPVDDAAIGSPFGNRDDPLTGRRAFHAGLDFAAERGTPIHAAAGGTVAVAGFKPDFGWVVEVEHGNGLVTRYAHASQLLVRAGQIVTPGEQIAKVGSSGRSTGPHLHFEVLRQGEATDPRRYLAGL